jgi:hypothetical protein
MWLNEGLAEFYSTFNGSERDSRMIVGRPIPAHRMLLREAGGLIPLKKFLDSTALPALLRDPRSTQRFYAESWALTRPRRFRSAVLQASATEPGLRPKET